LVVQQTQFASFFGDNVSFTSTSLGTPGISRSFNSFSEAADEAGIKPHLWRDPLRLSQ